MVVTEHCFIPQQSSTSGGHSQTDEGNVYPWKQREILTFDIPVHDSEKAGLGKLCSDCM